MTKKWTIGLCAAAAVLAGGVLAYAQGQIIVTTLTGTELFSVRTAGPQSAAISADESQELHQHRRRRWRRFHHAFRFRCGKRRGLYGAVCHSGPGWQYRCLNGRVHDTQQQHGRRPYGRGVDRLHSHTATLCEDTTSHVVYFGSGAGGICAGTSSLRFKHDVAPLDAGLKQVLALEPISYKLNADHGDANHTLYGFSAEQGGTVLPKLMGTDAQGKPNTFDYLGVVPVLVKAVQEQQAEIEHLKHQLALRRAQ